MFRNCFLYFVVTLLIFCNLNNANAMEIWDKVYPKSNNVNVQKVYFKNRYGIKLAGDLYIPKTVNKNEKMPAIAISGPFGAVKEQSSGFYAQTLAEKGFITRIYKFHKSIWKR